MPDSGSLLLFMAATIALNLTPGPDMLYVIARSTGEGVRSGVVSALGISGGTLFHLAAVTLGLATLLETVPLAFDAVRYAGAAYLVYLGVKTVGGTGAGHARPVERTSLYRVFRQGIVTNVLNPKVALFFAAFLPQFARPENGSVVAQLILLGLLFNLSGTIVNLLVALSAGYAGSRFRRAEASTPMFHRATGTIFILLGLRLALERRG